MGVLSLAIIFLKFFYKRKDIWSRNIKGEISSTISEAIIQNKPIKKFSLPSNLTKFKNLIEVLEDFDRRLTDPEWNEIKNKILDNFLLPQAKQKASSWSWSKRQLAARCYLLNPSKAPEKDLTALLNDPKFLVRLVAAVSITKIHNRSLFYAVIQKMSEEKSLARFSYRDALIQCDAEKFEWIEELLKSKPSPPIATICLDLLSERVMHNVLPTVIAYVYDKDHSCRLFAIKALQNFSSEESIEVLVNCLKDKSWEIRAEALKVLSALHATKIIQKVKPLLDDPIWFVRLQAALALKNLGSEGIKILSDQKKEEHPEAFEISKYVLSLQE